MTQKTYLSAQQLIEDSFRLGARVISSGFQPTIMIAIWRGGTPMGIAIQELLAYQGIDTDHLLSELLPTVVLMAGIVK